MEPIATVDKDNIAPERAMAVLVMILAGLVIFAAFAVSLYIWLGFFENDPQIEAMLPATALCFGVGILAIIPAAMTLRAANAVRKAMDTKRTAWTIVAFTLPATLLMIVLLVVAVLPIWQVMLGGVPFFLFTLWGLSRGLKTWKY